MRVYKDLGMVEQLGSGVPRILRAYNKNCYKFSENYLRLTLPASEEVSKQVSTQVTMQVTTQVEELIKNDKKRRPTSRQKRKTIQRQ